MPGIKICPNCKTENPEEAIYCRHCRFQFHDITNRKSLIPQIKDFIIDNKVYTIGSIIKFKWAVENAEIIFLNDIDVSSETEYELRVEKSEFHTLTVENQFNKSSRRLRISPKPLPIIRFFSASHKNVKSGQEIKLEWDTRNSLKTEIIYEDKILNIDYKNVLKLRITETTKFILRCYSVDSSIFIEEDLTINVLKDVHIKQFTADKYVVPESDLVMLTWDVENATDIVLMPLMKDVTNLPYYQVSPSRTTSYTLRAQNSLSNAEAMVSIGVRALPKIDIDLSRVFTPIEIPSVNIDMGKITKSMDRERIDIWMSEKPTLKLIKRIKLVLLFKKIKNLINRTLIWQKKSPH